MTNRKRIEEVIKYETQKIHLIKIFNAHSILKIPKVNFIL